MITSGTQSLVDEDGLDNYLIKSYFKARDFISYKNALHVQSSYYLEKFRLIYAIETKRFPQRLWDQVVRIKAYCDAETRMCAHFDWTDDRGLRKINLYELVVFRGKLPKRLLGLERRDLETDILQAAKLYRLLRFFDNKGRVFHSQVEDPSDPTISSVPNNLLSGVDLYDELRNDDVLQRASSDDHTLVLRYFTKAKMISGLLSLGKHDQRKLKTMNKSELSVLLMDEREIRDMKFWESFYVLTPSYQDLKEWLAVEKVYMEMAELLTGEKDMGLMFLPDISKKLRNTCKDNETVELLLSLAKRHLP
ncbi:MAG: hypothetical protein IPP83_07885 [Flavobacteriales bacterium]|nr:hypothetical protein [Flavobacteriales bacterium]